MSGWKPQLICSRYLWDLILVMLHQNWHFSKDNDRKWIDREFEQFFDQLWQPAGSSCRRIGTRRERNSIK